MTLSASDRKWVLEALVDYEPGTVLGVYSTKRRANKAEAFWRANPTGRGDDYQVTRHVVSK